MRNWTMLTLSVLMLMGGVVGCSSEVRVEDATVTLPRVAIVTATPEGNREAGTAAPRAAAPAVSVTAVSAGGVGPGPTASPFAVGSRGVPVVTVIASEGALLRAEPTTSAAALLTVPPGRNLVIVGMDISDGTSRWMHVRYGDREGYVRGDLVDQPHLG